MQTTRYLLYRLIKKSRCSGDSGMITLYAAEPPNSMKVVLALEELELPYTVVPVDLMLGAQFEPAFLRLNPNAKVPVIIDDDALGGRPHTAFESGAILLYLADKTGR